LLHVLQLHRLLPNRLHPLNPLPPRNLPRRQNLLLQLNLPPPRNRRKK
jgi:hypothetical protein